MNRMKTGSPGRIRTDDFGLQPPLSAVRSEDWYKSYRISRFGPCPASIARTRFSGHKPVRTPSLVFPTPDRERRLPAQTDVVSLYRRRWSISGGSNWLCFAKIQASAVEHGPCALNWVWFAIFVYLYESALQNWVSSYESRSASSRRAARPSAPRGHSNSFRRPAASCRRIRARSHLALV
jgi:hypothetical protein